jgi:hypothetical protein
MVIHKIDFATCLSFVSCGFWRKFFAGHRIVVFRISGVEQQFNVAFIQASDLTVSSAK